jgi:hypothetical protein
MNKQILSLFFLTIGIATYGQVEDNHKWDNVTIYEYGAPLTSCESNFENLFRNWPKWVTNYQQTELLSYKYVKTLEDSMLIDYYAEQLNNWKSLISRIKGSRGEKGNGDTTVYTRELYFYAKPVENLPKEIKNDPSKKALYQLEMNSTLKMMRKYFKETVHIGDKAYNIKLKIDGKEYDHYVICRPTENRVMFDNLFLRIHEMREDIVKYKIN